MKLHEIKWPVFQIRAHQEIVEVDKVLYLSTDAYDYIIDNKNLAGDNLGQRRIRLKKYLETNETTYKFYPLTKAFYTPADLYNNTHQVKMYIDYSGNIFKHRKTRNVPLVYKKVKEFKPVVKGQALAYCQGVASPILIPFMPFHVPKYLGLLNLPEGYILYELTQEAKKDTWRKI